jgi:predicted dehydrogenase
LNGQIGEILTAEATYNTGELWHKERQPGWTDMEYKLRNWLYYNWLSGDHIVEQAIHSVDMLQWAMGDVMPLSVTGTGGRQKRTQNTATFMIILVNLRVSECAKHTSLSS